MIAASGSPASKNDAAGDLRWYCLRARAKRESWAARQLQDRTGLEVFAPRLQMQAPRPRSKASSEPLFPGYLFARFDLRTDARFVSSTPDILGLVQFGRHVPPVDEGIISYLRTHTASPFVIEPVFIIGDWAQVLTGAFMGQTGQVIAFDQARERACLLLSLLGGQVRVQLPLHALRSPNEAHAFPSSLLATGT